MLLKSLLVGTLLASIALWFADAILPAKLIGRAELSTVSARSPEPGGRIQRVEASEAESRHAETLELREPGPRTLEIHGRVVDRSGDGIDAATLSTGNGIGIALSGEDGRYRIRIDAPENGKIALGVQRRGYLETKIDIDQRAAGDSEILGVEVVLAPDPGFTSFAGRIANRRGEGLGNQALQIRPRLGQGDENDGQRAVSDASGDFRFDGVRAGTAYKLQIEASDHYAGFTLESLTVLPGMAPLDIVLDSLERVDIDGLIVDSNNAPVANLAMQVQNLSLDYPDLEIESDSSGYFNLQRYPAGELKLLTQAPEFFRISGLRIEPGDYPSLTLVVDRGNHHLSGWVSDESGAPLASARVSLDAEIATDLYRSYSYRSMITDNSGRFHFADLGDTEHQIYVYASGYDAYIDTHRFTSFSDRHDVSLVR